MAFSDEQLKLIDACYRLDDLGELDGPTLSLELNKREARMLLEALDHFRDTRCPMENNGSECAMLFWTESEHTGAIGKTCLGCCDRLIDNLLSEAAQSIFGSAKR